MCHRGRGPGEILAVNPHFNFWAVITHRRTKLSGPYLIFFVHEVGNFFSSWFSGIKAVLNLSLSCFSGRRSTGLRFG